MIKYNLRYRGPFEYDKMVLNTLQYDNEVKSMLRKIKTGDYALLNKENNDFENQLNKFITIMETIQKNRLLYE